jgi:SAM-dependent methyltransferase
MRPRTRVMHAYHTMVRTRLGWRPLQNLVMDLRFGGWAGGIVASPFAAQGASRVQSTSYAALARLHARNDIRIAPDDVLVDVGCGRGRVINWWLSRGWRNRMVGLELVPRIAGETAERLRRFPNVEIRCGDAVQTVPPEGTFFYLYNPFDAPVMSRFADALLARADRPRELRIVYFNCRHLDVFADDPRWRVRRLDTGEPEPAALVTPAS